MGRAGLAGTVAAVLIAGMVSGCANGGGGGPGTGLAGGQTCGSIKTQLSRLDAKGVRSSIEAQSAGRKISPQQKADADSYNSLLNDYLKARCHEVKT